VANYYHSYNFFFFFSILANYSFLKCTQIKYLILKKEKERKPTEWLSSAISIISLEVLESITLRKGVRTHPQALGWGFIHIDFEFIFSFWFPFSYRIWVLVSVSVSRVSGVERVQER